jgi:hypothetical protein
LAFSDTIALTQLRMAADSASNSVYAPTGEAAASGNERWSENGGVAVPVSPSAIAGQTSVITNTPTSAPQVSRPNLVADLPGAPPKDPAPDPLPPAKIKGWQGFCLGFLGVESKALSMLSSTGKAAVPLLILLQPVVLIVGLVAGLLGLFGVHL